MHTRRTASYGRSCHGLSSHNVPLFVRALKRNVATPMVALSNRFDKFLLLQVPLASLANFNWSKNYSDPFIIHHRLQLEVFTNFTPFLIGFKTMRRSRVVFDQIKHVLQVFLNGFKNIPEKACVNRFHNNYTLVNVGNLHTIKTF